MCFNDLFVKHGRKMFTYLVLYLSFMQLTYMAIVLYAPALALSQSERMFTVLKETK